MTTYRPVPLAFSPHTFRCLLVCYTGFLRRTPNSRNIWLNPLLPHWLFLNPIIPLSRQFSYKDYGAITLQDPLASLSFSFPHLNIQVNNCHLHYFLKYLYLFLILFAVIFVPQFPLEHWHKLEYWCSLLTVLHTLSTFYQNPRSTKVDIDLLTTLHKLLSTPLHRLQILNRTNEQGSS